MGTTLQDTLAHYLRPDLRLAHHLRPLSFDVGIAPYAGGSVLVSLGHTRVICAASFEKKVPSWITQQGLAQGWLTAEYTMLPYSTLERKPRNTKGTVDGRSVEIQRLIGRALRSVLDLKKIPGYTLHIDCDVLQADGSTRVAAINGAYVAAQLAVKKLLQAKTFNHNPFKEAIAALSLGIVQDHILLDLCYLEDKEADMDCNIILTASSQLVELQASGEEATFSKEQILDIIDLAQQHAKTIFALQTKALEA